MTKKQALQLLFQAAGYYVHGAGVGLAHRPSPEMEQQLRQAVIKLWRDANNYDCSQNDLDNLGFR